MAQFTANWPRCARKEPCSLHPLASQVTETEAVGAQVRRGPGIKAATRNKGTPSAPPPRPAQSCCAAPWSHGWWEWSDTVSCKAPVHVHIQPKGWHEADGAQMFSWAAVQSPKPAPAMERKRWPQLWARLLPFSQQGPHGTILSQDMIWLASLSFTLLKYFTYC